MIQIELGAVAINRLILSSVPAVNSKSSFERTHVPVRGHVMKPATNGLFDDESVAACCQHKL